jgi:stalled ribosome rescue protein Dom34
MNAFFADIAKAVKECREVLLTGPGLTRQQFKDWSAQHATALSKVVVDCITSDHPTDAQLVAMARQYFKKFDAMAADPTQV